MIPASLSWRREHAKDLLAKVGTPQHTVGQVRAVEPADQHDRIAQPQLGDDVAAHALGGGRGECVHRDAGEFVAEAAELAVLGAEVVAPLADAVRLVDGDELDAAVAEQAAQPIAALADKPLRRDIEQAARIGTDRGDHLVALCRRQRAVQVRPPPLRRRAARRPDPSSAR